MWRCGGVLVVDRAQAEADAENATTTEDDCVRVEVRVIYKSGAAVAGGVGTIRTRANADWGRFNFQMVPILSYF